MWRAVIEQAMNDACILRSNPGVNRFPTPASRERDRLRATAGHWFKSAGPDFSLVCDWADLPADAVQAHVSERLATPAEHRSRSVRQEVWRAPASKARKPGTGFGAPVLTRRSQRLRGCGLRPGPDPWWRPQESPPLRAGPWRSLGLSRVCIQISWGEKARDLTPAVCHGRSDRGEKRARHV